MYDQGSFMANLEHNPADWEDFEPAAKRSIEQHGVKYLFFGKSGNLYHACNRSGNG
jgi:hypothetical protein